MDTPALDTLFVGTSETAALMRRRDWASTPMGTPDRWPQSVRAILRMMLTSEYAMCMGWGPDLRVLYNDAYARLTLGATHPWALGRPAREVWSERWPEIGPRIDHVLATGDATGDEELPLCLERSGLQEETYHRLSYSPLHGDDGRIVGICGVVIEGTTQAGTAERPRAGALAQTDRGDRLMELLSQTPVAIAILRGPSHVYEFANASYRELANHRNLLGRSVREVFPELEGQGVLELLDEVYRSGRRRHVPSLAVWVPGPDREPRQRYFDVIYQPLFDRQGRVEGCARVAFEVTELANARKAADAASRAKDDFLAMLGHELRNPLAPILTALQVLRLRGIDAGERERTVIERQVKHLVGLVDDLLDVSRITSGKVQLKQEPVELEDVIERAVELAGPLLEQQKHELSLSVPRRGLGVMADSERLSQVVGNLLTNAAKYTPPGGRIRVDARIEEGDVVLRVSDTGIGIDPEMLPRIFDLFTQDHQSLDRARGGLGLGLAIVRSLVAMHGGSVAAQSEGHGRGSTFVVRLPRTEVPRDVADSDDRFDCDRHRSASGVRVLVVDDNDDAAEMLADILSESGHTTETAHDGPSALRTAERFVPKVALVDIGLPVMDGFEVARQLRTMPHLGDIRLIAVTGYGQEHDRRHSLEAGFDEHLVKPVDLERLTSLMEQYTTTQNDQHRDERSNGTSRRTA